MTTQKQTEKTEQKTCSAETEVYSRVVGFYRPVGQWNPGKKEEFGIRQTYKA
jgi:ribonucleoside-triphosphate reductase